MTSRLQLPPMVRVAGKPILGHVLDNVVGSPVDEAVVSGVVREMVVDYVTEAYGDDLEVSFVDREQTKRLGHSVYQFRVVVGEAPACPDDQVRPTPADKDRLSMQGRGTGCRTPSTRRRPAARPRAA